MKKIIITGATSFIGLNMIKRFLDDGYFVYAVVRPDPSKYKQLPKSSHLKIIELEMQDYAQLDKKINDSCDVYFSLAWNGTRGAQRDDRDLQESNYKYSIKALEAASRLGCRLIFSAGSQAEYGLCTDYVSEFDLSNPVTWYGKYKLKYYEDAFSFCEHRSIDFKEPRFFSLYGANDFNGTMILDILRKMLNDEPCDLTECIQMWDFLHIDDAIDGLKLLMEKPCENGIYNFGSGICRPLRDFIEFMYDLSGSKSKLNFGVIPYPSTGMVNVMPDIKKLRKEVGFIPKVDFSDGIKQIISSMRG